MTVGVAVEKQCRLVHAVDNSIPRNTILCSAETGKGREQVRFVDDATNDLTRLDHSRPPGDGGDAHPSFGVVALAAGVECLIHARRAVVNHRPVVGHDVMSILLL